MSLARAITKRARRPSDIPDALPGAARKAGQSINRSLISPPVELLSTTNMLSYNAPDLPNPTLRHASTSSASSVGSKKSADDSDSSSPISSPDLTDASSVDSPSPTSPKPNHLSEYFAAANKMSTGPPPGSRPARSASTASLSSKASSNETSPAIPQRSMTHSKQAHERVARQRSLSGSMSRNSREHRTSADILAAPADPAHPFGKELEQLKEVVEEFGGVIAAADMDEDVIFMRDNGLAKFSASDYLFEIQPLFGMRFDHAIDRRVAAVQNDAYGWI